MSTNPDASRCCTSRSAVIRAMASSAWYPLSPLDTFDDMNAVSAREFSEEAKLKTLVTHKSDRHLPHPFECSTPVVT